jgi:hypothetical protein
MKKTNKENPLTFFRKANEARQKVVKNSLTKARNGMYVPAVVDAIRKGYYAINEDGTLNTNNRSNVDTVNQQYENLRLRRKEIEAKIREEARTKKTNKFQTDSLNEYMRDNPITPKKKGGSVKSKKK